MKRILAALALTILVLPAFAANVEQNSQPTELQPGYFDPGQ
jgi:hypothetical protein